MIFSLVIVTIFPVGAYDPSVLYKPNPNDPDPGCLYARAVQLKHQSNPANNGKMYATFEQYKKDFPVFPIYESTDNGETWTLMGNVVDQVNGWGMRYQPFLYELPQAIGSLPKGTLLCAGNSIPNDLSQTKIDIYYSTDLGRTWTFLSSVASGGVANPDGNHDPVWEPFLLVANNKLICYFADERDPRHNQKIVHKTSTDGVIWSDTVDDVALGSLRPGMPVVARMADGNYIMTYEIVGLDGIPFFYQISSNPEVWNASSQGTRFGGNWGSPYVAVMPDGKVVAGAYGTGDLFININNGHGTWYRIPTKLPGSYSRALVPLNNGRLFIIGGGPHGGSSRTQQVTYGDMDVGSMVPPNRIESYNYPGYFWRHYDYKGRIDPENEISIVEDAYFRIVPGLADPTMVSFESVNYPGFYLRHYEYELRLDQNDDTAIFKADATFKPVAGFADSKGVSYQSYNYPNRYIRHYYYKLRIDPINSELDKGDATFYIK